MRIAGVVLVFVGLIALTVALFSGCAALFSWNGRHVVDTRPLPEGESSSELRPDAGKRYTLGVQVVFDRASAPRHEGGVALEAKLPLVVRVSDRAGTTLAEVTGWLDPNEPPNVLYGHATPEVTRGPPPELLVERLVGPFGAASTDPLRVDVDLGGDRIGQTAIVERRLVIHDDSLPTSVRNAAVLALGGLFGLVGGGAVFVIGWFRRPRRAARGRTRDLAV